MQIVPKSYLKTVLLSDFYLWDVKRYYNKTNLNFDNVVTLGDILIPYRKPVSKDEMIKNHWQIIAKINFGGELFLRDFEEINTYKGNLNLIPENSLIYSKINVRHGCIYFHEKGSVPFGVSSEYPTYTFDVNRVNGNFLQKLLRSNTFKQLLNSKTTGISKARVKPNEFLDIQIPLPSLSDQQKFINSYNFKIGKAEQLKIKAKSIQDAISNYLFAELGIINQVGFEFKKGLNFIEYVNLTKWALSHLYKSNQNIFVNSKYKTKRIKDLLTFFEGGKTPSKSRNDFWNGEIFWTSPKDFNGQSIIDTAEDRITKLAVEETGIKVFPKGVFLSVFRSGILQHSFPTAITEIETAINQDLKAYSLKEDMIDSYYYLHFVHVFKKYILSNSSKKSVTVESINTEDFMELQIPLPPLTIQKKISEHINKLISESKKLQIIANEIEIQSQQEFENEIFSRI